MPAQSTSSADKKRQAQEAQRKATLNSASNRSVGDKRFHLMLLQSKAVLQKYLQFLG